MFGRLSPPRISFLGRVAPNQPSALQNLSVRGGQAVTAPPIPLSGSSTVDLELASTILLNLFGAVNAFHGVILAFLPSIGEKLLGTLGASSDDDAAYAEESIGAFALEYGLTGYLAASGVVAPDMAIGYGTLPDLLFLTKNLVNGKFAQFGVQRTMIVMTMIATACTAAVLTDNLHLGPILEVLTIIPAVQGSFKYFDPVGGAKTMMGADLSDKRKCLISTLLSYFVRYTHTFTQFHSIAVAKALYRHSGQVKIVSAVLRGTIAFGVKPLKALGYSCYANALLTLDSLVRTKTADDIDKKSALYHQIGSLVLALAMGTVFVLHGK